MSSVSYERNVIQVGCHAVEYHISKDDSYAECHAVECHVTMLQ